MTTLRALQNTKWVGQGELWLDPLGNTADTCAVSLEVHADKITYAWSHDGKPHTGTIALRDGGADFTDTFHSSTTMAFTSVSSTWALVELFGTYPAPEGPPWGWRITLAHRPSDELVLQMTNITPWGEDGRAVRMVTRRA